MNERFLTENTIPKVLQGGLLGINVSKDLALICFLSVKFGFCPQMLFFDASIVADINDELSTFSLALIILKFTGLLIFTIIVIMVFSKKFFFSICLNSEWICKLCSLFCEAKFCPLCLLSSLQRTAA